MNEEETKVDAPEEGANPIETVESPVEVTPETSAEDYKKKFSESSKEALRLFEESKTKDAEIERLTKLTESGANHSSDSDSLIDGFDLLSEEEQQNLLKYTASIEKRVTDKFNKNPAIAFAQETYNEKRWDSAFSDISSKYPDLSKTDFKAKYYKKGVDVPDNIPDLLNDLAKIELFDKAQDIGARKAHEENGRIEVERAKGGDKTPTATRSLEDYQRLSANNPMEFATKYAKQFNEDMASGKLN